MNRRFVLTLTVSALAACGTDTIRHGDAGPPEDASVSTDASGATADAGFVDGGSGGDKPDAGTCTLQVTPMVIDFGGTLRGTEDDASITIANIGNAPCTNLTAGVTPSTPAFQVLLPRVAQIEPRGSVPAVIRFRPNRAGYNAADATIQASGSSATVSVSGWGTLLDVPSNQTITYRIRNRTAGDIYVATEGWDCTPFDPGVTLQLSFQCGCECPPPPDPAVTRFVRVAAGATYDLAWDGRALLTWSYPMMCGPGFTVDIYEGALAPVDPISAPTRIAYETSLPSRCTAGSTPDTFECEPPQTGAGPGPVFAELCPTASEVRVPLVLRPGDITIEVPIDP